MFLRFLSLVVTLSILNLILPSSWAQVSDQSPSRSPIFNDGSVPGPFDTSKLSPVSKLDGVQFVNNSTSQVLLEKDGKQYLIDTQTRTIQEVAVQPEASTQASSSRPQVSGSSQTAGQTPEQGKKEEKQEKEVYYTEDIVLWTLPTTHHLEKKALMVDFTHRFSFEDGRVFEGQVLNNLFGLDGYSFSAFGLTYAITDTFFAGAYRLPSGLGRIIELYGGAQLSQEAKGHPFSSTFRVAVEGANHFRDNYVTSLELAFARSIKKRAQLYFVPTISFNNRPLTAPFGPSPELPGETTTAIGAGISVDFRPTVAVIAEGIQRTSGLLGVHRPAFMFGIQKKLYRHSFTLGLTNSPGTTLAQRSATRASLGQGFDDTFRGLTIGFNLSRRLF
jgi:Membrane bound beta barrel domain (DUF5777)